MSDDQPMPEMTHDAVRENPARYVLLSEEEGVETWLDTTTGLQLGFAFGEFAGVIETYEVGEPTYEDPEEDDAEELVFERPLQDVMRAMLDRRGYRYEQITDDLLHMVMRGSKGLHAITIGFDEKRSVVRMAGSYGPAVPAGRRAAVAESASRANVRLSLGNFELDFGDGELRFRVSMDVEGGLFSTQMADNMLGCTLHTMDRFADAFMRVAFGDVEPEVATNEA